MLDNDLYNCRFAASRPRWSRPHIESLFRYSSLKPASCQRVSRESCEIKSLIRRSAQDLRAIGEKLSGVEQELGKEKFVDWVRFELGWSVQAAQQYIGFARESKDRNFGSLKDAAFVLLSLVGMSRLRGIRVLQSQKHSKISCLPAGLPQKAEGNRALSASNVPFKGRTPEKKARVKVDLGGVPIEVEGIVTSVQLAWRHGTLEGTIQVPIQEVKFL